MEKSGAPADFLANHGWLSFTPPGFQKNVLARIQTREFRKGEAVYRAGDPPGGLWVVLSGAVELELPPPDDAPHFVHLAAPGFWFGEWPLIWDKPRRLTVIATGPSTLATLPLAECRAMLEAEPAAWRWVALLSTMSSDLAAGIVSDLLVARPGQENRGGIAARRGRPKPCVRSRQNLHPSTSARRGWPTS